MKTSKQSAPSRIVVEAVLHYRPQIAPASSRRLIEANRRLSQQVDTQSFRLSLCCFLLLIAAVLVAVLWFCR